MKQARKYETFIIEMEVASRRRPIPIIRRLVVRAISESHARAIADTMPFPSIVYPKTSAAYAAQNTK